MRTTLIVLVCALMWAASAQAYHSDGYHWPGPGTVAANGGGEGTEAA